MKNKLYRIKLYYIAFEYGDELEYFDGPFGTYSLANNELERLLVGEQEDRLVIVSEWKEMIGE